MSFKYEFAQNIGWQVLDENNEVLFIATNREAAETYIEILREFEELEECSNEEAI